MSDFHVPVLLHVLDEPAGLEDPDHDVRHGAGLYLNSLRQIPYHSTCQVENAALAAAKILALKDEKVRERVGEYQERKKREVEEADREVSC